jgi:hypothetical protein
VIWSIRRLALQLNPWDSINRSLFPDTANTLTRRWAEPLADITRSMTKRAGEAARDRRDVRFVCGIDQALRRSRGWPSRMEGIAHEAVELGYADRAAQCTRFGSGAANCGRRSSASTLYSKADRELGKRIMTG